MPLEAENLKKRYAGRTVVQDVSLKVAPGEVVGLLGPNGAGKTTAFYMVIGLVRPDGGQVTLSGQDITRLPMHRRARSGIGYLPQENSIFRKLTVGENLDAVLEHMPISPRERHDRREELLEEFSIGHLKDAHAFTLSGGERRRAEIARALATSPRYLLLDEPFAGIDPIAVSEIQGIVERLKERGLGVLITDHNVRETLQITDRAYIIYQGAILESGTPRQVAESANVRNIYLGERFAL
ncbi:MAG: LPS export ABC transporter ATP-binding protein [Nitrospirota bacterium]|nr:LPS export ABC transporter ATP-binding protein [Nitrospirota bacterium]